MKLIKFNSVEYDGPTFVNPKFVMFVEEDADKENTEIYLTNDNRVLVSEPIDKVIEELEKQYME